MDRAPGALPPAKFRQPSGQGGFLRRPTILGLAGLGIVALVVLAGIWQFDRPPFELTKLQLLETGMSRAQVADILGLPRSDFGEHWAYARTLSWPIVQVYFDASGKLIRYEYDR